MTENPYGGSQPGHGQDPNAGQSGPTGNPPSFNKEDPPTQSYGAQAGYGNQPGYEGQSGYGNQQNYGDQSGYGQDQSGYGQPQQPYAPPPQPPYGPPPQGYGPGYPAEPMPGSADLGTATKGFLPSLFDFDFTSFVTPKIIKVLYILVTVLIGLGYVVFTVSSFVQNAGVGVLVLIFGAVVALVYLALTRVVLEFYMAVFRMSNDIQEIKRQRL